MVSCKHCGAAVAAERVELGYDYCTGRDCVAVCLQGPDIVAVGVNKAADQYVRREDLKLARVPRSTVVTGDQDYPPFAPRRPKRRPPLDVLSDAGRIATLEAELDQRLAQLGPDDRAERRRLIDGFNAGLRGFNIRYRTLARRAA
jgi:hypothetical protein